MSEPTTPDRWAALREARKAATPGEWRTERKNDWTGKVLVGTKEDDIADCDVSVYGRSEANAHFIALAANAVLPLLDEVARLRAAIEEHTCSTHLGTWCAFHGKYHSRSLCAAIARPEPAPPSEEG